MREAVRETVYVAVAAETLSFSDVIGNENRAYASS